MSAMSDENEISAGMEKMDVGQATSPCHGEPNKQNVS